MLCQREVHGDEVPVFPAASSKRPGLNWKDPNNMTAYIREARLGAKMDWPVTSHTFRKTAATIWHDSGLLTDRQKADLTGHREDQHTYRHLRRAWRASPARRGRHGCRLA